MKRDMKLIRKLLAYVEGEFEDRAIAVPEIVGYSSAEIHDHIGLCYQAGFLEKTGPRTTVDGEPGQFGLKGLTWEGHNALGNLRAGLSHNGE